MLIYELNWKHHISLVKADLHYRSQCNQRGDCERSRPSDVVCDVVACKTYCVATLGDTAAAKER